MIDLDFLGLFLILIGFVLGLGAVTVIDFHGFLARKSSYWTLATTRSHKITKPLIWTGIILLSIGYLFFFASNFNQSIPKILSVLVVLLILNGCFLSFYVSPFLLRREREGRESELLPQSLQGKIFVSFCFSIMGWWGSLIIFTWYLTNIY